MIYIIDDCHENFDRLYSYPVHEWHGGILELEDSDFKRKRKQLDKGWLPLCPIVVHLVRRFCLVMEHIKIVKHSLL